MLNERHIKLYSTFSCKKASIVERFNRTLKGKMWRRFSLNGSYKWLSLLPVLIAEYNDTRHRTIRMKPNQVNTQNQQSLLDTVYNHSHHIKHRKNGTKFKTGYLVRLSKYKHIFEKGYTPN